MAATASTCSSGGAAGGGLLQQASGAVAGGQAQRVLASSGTGGWKLHVGSVNCHTRQHVSTTTGLPGKGLSRSLIRKVGHPSDVWRAAVRGSVRRRAAREEPRSRAAKVTCRQEHAAYRKATLWHAAARPRDGTMGACLLAARCGQIGAGGFVGASADGEIPSCAREGWRKRVTGEGVMRG